MQMFCTFFADVWKYFAFLQKTVRFGGAEYSLWEGFDKE